MFGKPVSTMAMCRCRLRGQHPRRTQPPQPGATWGPTKWATLQRPHSAHLTSGPERLRPNTASRRSQRRPIQHLVPRRGTFALSPIEASLCQGAVSEGGRSALKRRSCRGGPRVVALVVGFGSDLSEEPAVQDAEPVTLESESFLGVLPDPFVIVSGCVWRR